MTAFEILTKKHDYIQRNGEKPSEYNEDKIIEAMEEYAQQQVKKLNIPDVVWQSEQLLAFAQYLHNHSYVNKGFKPETLVRRFKGE